MIIPIAHEGSINHKLWIYPELTEPAEPDLNQVGCNDGTVMLRSRCSFIYNKRRSGRQSLVNSNKSKVGKAHT